MTDERGFSEPTISRIEVKSGRVLDVMGTEVLSRVPPDAQVLFVDLRPESNWAHRCLYLIVESLGVPKSYEHNFPPADVHYPNNKQKSESILSSSD